MSNLHAGHRIALIGRTAVVAALTLSIVGCSSGRGRVGPRVTVAPPRSPAGSTTQPPAPPAAADRHQPRLVPALRVRVTDARGTGIMTLPLEEYVLGAVRAELLPRTLQEGAADPLIQVQAIVSRTYAIANLGRHAAEGFDLCDSAHCQLYRPGLRTEGPTDRVARVVAETREEVVTFEGRVIQALFHSNCGGHTTSASSVWGGPDQPYLRPVVDTFCASMSPGDWTFAVTESDLRRALNSDPRTAVGSTLHRIEVTDRNESGRAGLLTLAGSRTPMVRAEEFRAVMGRVFGPQAIRSTWFTVSRRDGRFVFAGVGYGHGVGLCQVGATLRARSGQSPIEIIAHYFPGTRVERAAVALALPSQPLHIGEIP